MTRPKPRRHAFTLIELLVALASATILFLAMGSAVALAARAVPAGDDPTDATLRATDIMARLADETKLAIVVGINGDMIGFYFPDTSGDGAPDPAGWYVSDGKLLRMSMRGTETVATNVTHFEFFVEEEYNVGYMVEYSLSLKGMAGSVVQRRVDLLQRPEVRK